MNHHLICCLHMLFSFDGRLTGRAWDELVKHGHVLPQQSKRQRGVHSFVQMHAPDQTADRPHLLHCSNDLGRECHWIECRNNPHRFSSRFVDLRPIRTAEESDEGLRQTDLAPSHSASLRLSLATTSPEHVAWTCLNCVRFAESLVSRSSIASGSSRYYLSITLAIRSTLQQLPASRPGTRSGGVRNSRSLQNTNFPSADS